MTAANPPPVPEADIHAYVDGRLPAGFSSAIVGLGPDEIEAAIEALLGQLGEDLSAERVALLATANRTPLKSWARPDTAGGDAARKCLVTGRGAMGT
jgi:hypothetical protein